jgi:hypothetical protein
LASQSRTLRLITLFIVLLGAVYIASGTGLLRRLGHPGALDVWEVMESGAREGSVTVRGVVDITEPEEGVIFLRDLRRREAFIDSVYVFAVMKVRTPRRFREGETVEVSGLIEYEDGFPVIVSR